MRNDSPRRLFALALLILVGPTFSLAQSTSPQAQSAARVRITQTIDENQLTELRGNIHPLARLEFDRGVAPLNMTLHRMLLVLNRAPEQQAALERFLADLHDHSSPNYHKWLTPEQFGHQFGPADEDLQTVTSWLRSHGFQVDRVTNGRSSVEFSGSVAQVREAFHTEIHRYVVSGEEHWANSSDPQIPSALTPVVADVATLHNFLKHTNLAGMSRYASVQRGPKGSVNLCSVSQSPCPTNDIVHALGPGDLSTIYNAPNSLNANQPAVPINGDAIRVGVVERSNLNLNDIQTFRDFFGLEANFTQSNIVLNGPDPGNLGGGEEIEAVLDASWAGAAAPNATIDFVVSQTTETMDGVDLSEVFIVDNNLVDVMSESFGICEQDAGQGLANLEATIAEQAAAQGITFLASSGDSGAACSSTATEMIATQIPASLPYVTAVGGTMFIASDAAFWSSSNNQITRESALKYIPEDVWNETFPNGLEGAGGGGVSALFKAPPWQAGVTGLSGSMRQVPDVSLNAAAGHDPFIICVADQNASCLPGSFVILVGGTSASAPSFAGIMALVVESQANEPQGQAGYVLYDLAAAEMNSPATLAACNSTSVSPPASTCVFNDITAGNNVFTGEVGSTTDFQAAPGYDLASGLGSVNVANLIGKWKTAGTTRGTPSSTTLSSTTTFPITHGSPVSLAIIVAPQTGSGTPTGDVSVVVSPTAGSTVGTLPGGMELTTFTLANGSVTSSTNTLPGGTYSLAAHYEGDGTFLPSDSAPFGPISVSPESSQTEVLLVLLNPATGAVTFPTTLPYGSNDAIRVNVTSTNVSAPCAKLAVGDFGCPTGTVTINKNTGSALDGGTFALNSLGYTEDQGISATLAPGSYNMQANYAGDLSFTASSGSEAITITSASTTAALSASSTSISTTGSTTLTASISTQSFGKPPTGSVTFTLNGNVQLGSVAVSGSFSANTGFAQATAVLNVSASQLQTGSNSIIATYNGDANYAASPASSMVTVSVGGNPSFTLALTPLTVTIPSPGASGQATLMVTAMNGFNGTIPLNASVCSGLPSESSCSFSSASITGSGSVMVTIATTSPSALARRIRRGPFGPWTSLGSLTLALLLGAALLSRIRPLRRRLAFTFGLVIAASLLAMEGCGGGGGGGKVVSNPGTPVGNDTNAVITLTSGSITNSITFSVNVQ